MNPSRLTCVLPGYWPVPSRSAGMVTELAQSLGAAGRDGGAGEGRRDRGTRRWSVDIVTARLSSGLPDCFLLDECLVRRVGNHASHPWRRSSFFRAAARAVAAAVEPELLILFECIEQVGEFRAAVPGRCPVVVRFDSPELSRSMRGVFAQRRVQKSLGLADEIWTASESQTELLQSLGLDPSRIRLVPECVADRAGADCGWTRSLLVKKQEARSCLGELHAGLAFQPGEKMVACCLPMSQLPAFRTLLAAWKNVVRNCPAATLWITGEGPCARETMELVQQQDLNEHVVFPGAFDSPGEILAASDLLVHPAPTDWLANGWLQAMREGVPVLAVHSTAGSERWLVDGSNIATVSGLQPDLLAERLLWLLSHPQEAESIGLRGLESVRMHRPLRLWQEAMEGLLQVSLQSGREAAR